MEIDEHLKYTLSVYVDPSDRVYANVKQPTI